MNRQRRAWRPFARFLLLCGPAACSQGPQGDGPSMQGHDGGDGVREAGGDGGESPPDAGDTALRPEVGFFDVPAQPTASKYPARLFYVFEPADVDPDHKPLVVVFNGGPGAATSAMLLAYGTGRWTLDPPSSYSVDVVAHENRASWTAFANLLYIDARQAGFSYGLGRYDDFTTCTFSPVEDASDFVRAVLDFLDGHAALRDSPVILAGESYGGVRATWMLDLLLRYSTEASKGGADLEKRIQSHYDTVFLERAGTVVDEATAARQFGAQILVEPMVFGLSQLPEQSNPIAADPSLPSVVPPGLGVSLMPSDGGLHDGAPVDTYDELEPAGWSDGLDVRAMQALSIPGQASRLLGVDLDAVGLLGPAARHNAFHLDTVESGDVANAETAMNGVLSVQLGELSAGDRYFVVQTAVCVQPASNDVGPAFLANLRTVRTFITNARYDPVIHAPAIPRVVHDMGLGGDLDTSPRPGVARPGWFRVNLPAENDGGAAKTIEVRFPPYTESGHMVSVTQPAELSADVKAWLERP